MRCRKTNVVIAVPLQLEGHQGAVGLCTGKTILDVFLTFNHHIYTPLPIPPPSWLLEVSTGADAAALRQREFLTMCYNCLSSLQYTTVFRQGPVEKKVDAAASCRFCYCICVMKYAAASCRTSWY
jgi:hypothetical protein